MVIENRITATQRNMELGLSLGNIESVLNGKQLPVSVQLHHAILSKTAAVLKGYLRELNFMT